MSKCLPTWVFIACIFFTGAFTPVVADADSDYEGFAEGFGGDENIANNDESNDNDSSGDGNKKLGSDAEGFANWLGNGTEDKSDELGNQTEDFVDDDDGWIFNLEKYEFANKADKVEDKSDGAENEAEGFVDNFATNIAEGWVIMKLLGPQAP